MKKKLLPLGSRIWLEINNKKTEIKIAQYFEDDNGKIVAYLGISQDDFITNMRIGIDDKFKVIE